MTKKTKIYTGNRKITAKFHHLARDGRTEIWFGYIDGRSYYGISGHSEAEAIAAAYRAATKMDIDAAIYPAAKAVAGELHSKDAAGLAALGLALDTQTKDDFFLGQTVAVYSRGQWRIGLVEKVGRTNVTVVYVTASTGALWRKADKFGEIVILDPKHPLDEYRQAERAADKRDQEAPVIRQTTPATAAEIFDENRRMFQAEVAEPELCDHVGTERVNTEKGALSDNPGQPQVLCVDCGAEVDDDSTAAFAEVIRTKRLAGLRTERLNLRGRIHINKTTPRPELWNRLYAVEAEMTALGACTAHWAYDADNCPGCGTAAAIGSEVK